MKLFIDTSNNLKTVIKLGDSQLVKTYSSPRDQNVLSAIDQLLNQQHKSLTDITQIEVNPGPGHFTSLRVGIAIANVLSYALKIPVNGQKPPLIPHYGQPPNITRTKT